MGGSALPGGEDEEGDGIVAEINVTPLTDIFLVLLIIFMVTTTAVTQEGKNIDLPSAEVASETTPEGVTVEVDDAGVIHVNGEVVSEGGLAEALEVAEQDGIEAGIELLDSVEHWHKHCGPEAMAQREAKAAELEAAAKQRPTCPPTSTLGNHIDKTA